MLNVMKSVVKVNKIRPIISTISVKNGVAIGTDLYTTVITKTELTDGLYDTNGFKVDAVMVNKKSASVHQDDFPDIKVSNNMSINGCYDIKKLLNILNVCKSYIGSPDNLSVHGVRFEEDKIITTNTFSLVMYDAEHTIKPVTIHGDTIKTLIATLKEEKTGKVRMLVNDNNVMFETNNYKILGRVIDLYFPDVKSILAGINNNMIVRINRKELAELLKKHIKVSKLSENKYSSFFTITKNKFIIKSSNPTTSITDEIECVSNSEIKIVLNDIFIYDFVSNLKSEYVQIKFGTQKSAVEIAPELENGYLLTMPLAIEW